MELTPLAESDPVLRQKAIPFRFDQIDLNLSDLISSMMKMMIDRNLVGLAAPQLGIPWRILTLNIKGLYKVCINPRVVQFGAERVIMEEGCLSVPGCFMKLRRPSAVKVMYQRPDQKWIHEGMIGLEARVYQHEVDHLNGLLINDGKTTPVRESMGIVPMVPEVIPVPT